MILITAITMLTLTIQANEAESIEMTVSSADAASAPTELSAPAEEDINTTIEEEK